MIHLHEKSIFVIDHYYADKPIFFDNDGRVLDA